VETFFETLDKLDVILDNANYQKPRFSSAWRAHVVNGCRRTCFYCAMEKKLRDVPTTEAVQS
jgi:hypothetical protein